MQFYDKQEIMDQDVRPLMDEVQRICRQHSIQYSATFMFVLKKQGENIIDGHTTTGYILNDDDFPTSTKLALVSEISHLEPEQVMAAAKKLGFTTE